jgi:lipid A disaccharide synthetase
MISTLVEEERSRFRSESKIADTATVFFLAPGNTEAEVKWSLSILNKGIEKFFQRDEIKNLDKQNFVAVVSIPEHGATTNAIESLINQTKFGCRVVTVKTDNDKWSAMAGSDIGLAVNGEIVSECAAAQLPTVVLDNTPFLQAYFTQLYNSFNVDINIAINGEAYQELLNGANNPT